MPSPQDRHGSAANRLRAAVAITTSVALLLILATSVRADPASDALVRLAELSRQAERTSEEIYSAQIDLDAKRAAASEADGRYAEEQARADVANADLRTRQATVDRFAAALYMGGRIDALSGLLTAPSPNVLIQQLTFQRLLAEQMSSSLAALRVSTDATARAADTARQTSELARQLADEAARIRDELDVRRRQLEVQIAAVQTQYDALSTEQRAVLADPGPPPPTVVAAPGALEPSEPAPLGAVGFDEGARVVQAALTRVGAPYEWGAAGPDAFDCSGLIQWSFQQAGMTLPRSSQALAAGGAPVAVADLRPGDIVTFYGDASHAGIYIGEGMMVHSSTYGVPVKVAPISSAPIYNARRY